MLSRGDSQAFAGSGPGWPRVEALDCELSRRAREVGFLKLRLAESLEVLGRDQGHHALGFSSLEAYVRERCERSGRWAAQLRTVARRLAALSHCRAALVRGGIQWSHAEVLARYASAETEQHLLGLALKSTVRQLRAACAGLAEKTVTAEEAGAEASELLSSHALVLTLDQEDAWLLESTRWLAQAQGVRTQEEFVNALLAEGWTTFIAWSETTGQDIDRCLLAWEKRASEHRAQQAYNAERQRWREAAEVLCEPVWQARVGSVPAGAQAGAKGAALDEWVVEGDAERLDAEIHGLAQALAERDVELGRLLLQFHAADGFRRLGFASFSQYAEERLGMSYASVKARLTLARRALRFPAIAEAVSERRLGFEAAMLIARVASSSTVAAWIERAAERTLKHLAEEVEAACMLSRLALASEVRPPSEGAMADLSALRGKIMATTIAGEVADVGVAQQHAIEDLKDWARCSESRGGQTSAGAESEGTEEQLPRRVLEGRGRRRWRFRVDGDTLSFFRAFEDEFRRHSVRGFGFVRYLCLAFWMSWWRSKSDSIAYAEIYRRDAYCCASPVCRRHDVTPHHLRFRSQGGGDEAENLLSLCVWCHLYGVHEGRLSVRPPASTPYWEIGSVRVHGRRRLAA